MNIATTWTAEHMLDECIVAVYERVTAMHTFMGCSYMVTGIPQPLLNGVINAKISEEDCKHAVPEIIKQLDSADIPYSWWANNLTAPPSLWETLKANGLKPLIVLPGMSIELSTESTHSLPDGVSIQRVSDVESLRIWAQIICTVYDMRSITDDIVRLYMRDAFSDNLVHFIGQYLGNSAVAGTIIFRPEGFYIFNVATLPAFQRLGLARSLCKHMIGKAWDKGYRRGVLQTSSMGASFYETLGFRPLSDCRVFVKTASWTRT
ncbi:MAG: GNAT family N-acetyltransferase [Chlamydiales bacterium]|nr:GNAT family N-acetyltransferase [Chlamydiales bacterium]